MEPYGDDGASTTMAPHYSLLMKTSFLIMDNAINDVMTSINSVPFSPDNTGNPFVICDLGTADGGVSLKLIDAIIQEVRRLYPTQEILIQYEDQPDNDYKSLFYNVQGLNKITDAANKDVVPYMLKHENVFVTCSGTSFHKQCFPSNTVHFSMCFTSIHWLSKLPCRLPNNMMHTLIPRDSHALIAFQSQAEEDWNAILVNRGKELRVGARFVVVNLCADEDGYYAGSKLYKVFEEIWNEMREDGVISQNEFEEATFLVYFRTEGEVRRPFLDPCSEVSKLGLKIVSLRSQIIECPHLSFWKTSKSTISVEEYAKLLVGTLRSFSNSTFFSALNDNRTREEKECIVDEVYNRYSKRIAKEPDNYELSSVRQYIVIEKEAINE